MLGLCLRAAGADKRIFIGQFLKDDDYSEILALKKFLPQIKVEQYGAGEGFIKKGNPSERDISCAKRGYDAIYAAVSSGDFDLVIADELNVACYYDLISPEQILYLMEQKASHTELVITGRYAKEEVMEAADLVTEMKQVKHYYEQGVPARVGIEK